MIETDDLDQMWRETLATAADRAAPLSDPRDRVARRVKRNRRVRVTINATVAFAVVIVIAAAVVFVSNHANDSPVRVATTTPTPESVPVAVVHVTDAPGNQLLIVLPDYQAERTSREVTLPAGDVRLVIDLASGGHELRIEGVPGFDVIADSTPQTVTTDVNLGPGTYRMYCAVPGHEAAGEYVDLIVH